MTKEEYLERLLISKNEVSQLIAKTRAGALRVGLERIWGDVVYWQERIEKMSDEHFEQWVAV